MILGKNRRLGVLSRHKPGRLTTIWLMVVGFGLVAAGAQHLGAFDAAPSGPKLNIIKDVEGDGPGLGGGQVISKDQPSKLARIMDHYMTTGQDLSEEEKTNENEFEEEKAKNDLEDSAQLPGSNEVIPAELPAGNIDNDWKRLKSLSPFLLGDATSETVDSAAVFSEIKHSVKSYLNDIISIQKSLEDNDEEAFHSAIQSFIDHDDLSEIEGIEDIKSPLAESSIENIHDVSDSHLFNSFQPHVLDDIIQHTTKLVSNLEEFDLLLASGVSKSDDEQNDRFEFDTSASHFGTDESNFRESTDQFNPKSIFDHPALESLISHHVDGLPNFSLTHHLNKLDSFKAEDVVGRHSLRLDALGSQCPTSCAVNDLNCNCAKLFECARKISTYDMILLLTKGYVEKNPSAERFGNFTVNVTDLHLFDAAGGVETKLSTIKNLVTGGTPAKPLCTQVLQQFFSACDPSKEMCSKPNKNSFQLTTRDVCKAADNPAKLSIEVLGDEFDGFRVDGEVVPCKPASYGTCIEFAKEFDRLYEGRDKSAYQMTNPMLKDATRPVHDQDGNEVLKRVHFPVKYDFTKTEQGMLENSFGNMCKRNPSGCYSISTEADCLKGVDGRPPYLGEHCAWCPDGCTSSVNNDFQSGDLFKRPQVQVTVYENPDKPGATGTYFSFNLFAWEYEFGALQNSGQEGNIVSVNQWRNGVIIYSGNVKVWKAGAWPSSNPNAPMARRDTVSSTEDIQSGDLFKRSQVQVTVFENPDKPEANGTYFSFELTDWVSVFGTLDNSGEEGNIVPVNQWRNGIIIYSGNVKVWTANAWPSSNPNAPMARRDTISSTEDIQSGDLFKQRPQVQVTVRCEASGWLSRQTDKKDHTIGAGCSYNSVQPISLVQMWDGAANTWSGAPRGMAMTVDGCDAAYPRVVPKPEDGRVNQQWYLKDGDEAIESALCPGKVMHVHGGCGDSQEISLRQIDGHALTKFRFRSDGTIESAACDGKGIVITEDGNKNIFIKLRPLSSYTHAKMWEAHDPRSAVVIRPYPSNGSYLGAVCSGSNPPVKKVSTPHRFKIMKDGSIASMECDGMKLVPWGGTCSERELVLGRDIADPGADNKRWQLHLDGTIQFLIPGCQNVMTLDGDIIRLKPKSSALLRNQVWTWSDAGSSIRPYGNAILPGFPGKEDDNGCFSSTQDKKLAKTAMRACDESMNLLVGSTTSVGRLKRIADLVNDPNKGPSRMPGVCCLDNAASSAYFGFDYIPKINVNGQVTAMTCQNPGPWHLGISKEACANAGGQWVRTPCVTLKECIDSRPSEGEGFSAAFEKFASGITISDASDEDQCRNAREKLGYDRNYGYDSEVCERFKEHMCGDTFDAVDTLSEGTTKDQTNSPVNFQHVSFTPDQSLHFTPLLDRVKFQKPDGVGSNSNLNALQDAMLESGHVLATAEHVYAVSMDAADAACEILPEQLCAGFCAINPLRIACQMAMIIMQAIARWFLVAATIAHQAIDHEYEKATLGPSETIDVHLYSKATFENFEKFYPWTMDTLDIINKNIFEQHKQMRQNLQDRHQNMVNCMLCRIQAMFDGTDNPVCNACSAADTSFNTQEIAGGKSLWDELASIQDTVKGIHESLTKTSLGSSEEQLSKQSAITSSTSPEEMEGKIDTKGVTEDVKSVNGTAESVEETHTAIKHEVQMVKGSSIKTVEDKVDVVERNVKTIGEKVDVVEKSLKALEGKMEEMMEMILLMVKTTE